MGTGAAVRADTDLPAHPVGRRPQSIIFFSDFAVIDYPLQLLHHALVDVGLEATPSVKTPLYRIPSHPTPHPSLPLTSFLIITSFL